jgi:hypothetical protein
MRGSQMKAKRAVFVAVMLLSGCAASGNTQQAEFVLRDVPSVSTADLQGMAMYVIEGRGKRCYIAGIGVAKVLLWCEEVPR